ncbi:hypothetical protein PLEI_4286 [Photobacterium leiognathi lrivu.4.1]|uniref:Uncharacterized protein n=1 Tax=Photobacterium leiognathi lrivu.4.1 TaxID=1248232 RepID=V5H6J9_PHOLE|nr:methyl-accepting chemotaxis protein [Photobacterium leiognathi]GAD32607.1 hypothetical protein PLEI_4286 [Photobacterium leiognathi lrivu.4.1]
MKIILFILIAAAYIFPLCANATHFRGGGFTWTMFDDDGDGQKNDLIVTYTSACASGNDGCASFTNSSTLTTPISTNPVNKDIDGYRLRVDQRLFKNISLSNTYAFVASSSARISGLQNNSEGSWLITAVVDPRNGNLPPQIDLPILLQVPKRNADSTTLTSWQYQISGFDPNGDNYRFRLATNAEMGPGTQPPGFSVSQTGLITWGSSGSRTTGLYSAGVVVEDLDDNGSVKTSSQFDIMLDLRNASATQFTSSLPTSRTVYLYPDETYEFSFFGSNISTEELNNLNGTLTEPTANNFKYDATGVNPGTYTTTVRISSTGAVLSYENVTFIVQDPDAPILNNMDGERQYFALNVPVFIDVGRDATVQYTREAHLNGGKLQFNVNFSLGAANLSLDNSNGLTIQNNELLHNGVKIADIDLSKNGQNSALLFSFTSEDATIEVVEKIVRNLQYTSTASSLPSSDVSGTLLLENSFGSSSVKPLSIIPLLPSDPMMVLVNFLNGTVTNITAEQLNAIIDVDSATPMAQMWYEESLMDQRDTGFVDYTLPTPYETQKIIDAVNTLQLANGTDGSQLSVEDFENAGLEGVTQNTLPAMQEMMTSGGFTSLADIQTAITAYNANYDLLVDDLTGNADGVLVDDTIINGILNNGTAMSSLSDWYSEAMPLASVTHFLEPAAPSLGEVQEVVDAVNLLNEVIYSIKPSSDLTQSTFGHLGITGVNSDNIVFLREYITTQIPTSLADIQSALDGYVNIVDDINGNVNLTPVTAEELNTALNSSNALPQFESLYSDALSTMGASTTSFTNNNQPSTLEIEQMIANINLLGAIMLNDDEIVTGFTPNVLTELGLTGITSDNFELISEQISLDNVNTLTEIEALVMPINVIVDDMQGNNDTVMVSAAQLNQYLGNSSASVPNESLYSEALSDFEPTTANAEDIQAMVTAVNNINSIIQQGEGSGVTLENSDLEALSLSGVPSSALLIIQEQLETGNFTTIAEIKSLVNNVEAIVDDINSNIDNESITAQQLNVLSNTNAAVTQNESIYSEALDLANPENSEAIENIILSSNILADTIAGSTSAGLSPADLDNLGVTGADLNNISFIEQQIATGEYTNLADIQTLVNNVELLLSDINDPTNSVSISADQLNALSGIDDAIVSNENLYSEALDSLDASTATISDVSSIVTLINDLADVINNGENSTATIDEIKLTNLGIDGVTIDNISLIEEQIESGKLTSIADIQDAVDGLNAILEDINGNDDGTSASAEEINQLVGIDNANESNEALYTEAFGNLDSDTLTNQDIIDAVAATNDFVDIMTNGTDATATLDQDEMEDIGITGLDSDNTDLILDQIEGGDLGTIADIQNAVDGLNAIIEDINGNDDGMPTSADEINQLADIDDATESNEPLYTEAFGNLDIDTLTNQDIIDAVAATNDLADVIINGTDATATLEQEELEAIGITDLDSVSTPLITDQIASGELTTIADIQDVLDGLNAIIDDINGNEDGQLVTAEEINRLVDIDNATESNQDLYSEAFSRLDSEALTTQDITAAVSAVNDLADMFVNGTDATATLEQSELEAVGISGLDDSSTERVIDKINSGELTSIESIQDYVSAYNIINDYLDDPTKTPPSSLDYETVGIMAVSDTNLSEINQGLKDKLVVAFDDIQALVDTVNIPSLENDMDGDGIIDDWDKDMDGDGVVNHLDAFPADKFASVDFNGDGVPDAGIQPLRSVNVGKNDSVIVNSGEVLEFVPITLTTGASLEDVSSRFGKVVIIDNKILFQAPEKVPEQLYINYQWKDINGDVFDELLKMTSGSTNVDAPVFGNLGPKEIDAEGLFTKIDALTPTAFDILGNPIPVSIDGTPRIRSGNQVVYWVAKDDQGRESIAGQLFKVNPQVNIEQNRIAYEGEKSTLTIRLNGLAPDYPVNIPLSIAQGSSSSDSSDHGLSPTMILSIEKDRTALVEFDVYADDVIEGKETLVVNLDPSVNKGVYDSVQIDINEGTPIPVIEANVIDREGQILTLAYPELAEGLFVSADIVSFATDIEFEWYYRRFGGDAEFIGNTLNNNSLAIGKALSIGRHEFEFIGTAVNEEIPPILGKALLRVIEPKELSFDIDSDRDGISDKDEGFVDSDGDLIPDYLDSVDVCELQVIDNDKVAMSGGYVLESTPGSCMKLGLVSESVGSYSPFVNVDDLGEALNDIFKLPVDDENLDAYVESEVHNYTVTNVLNESVTVVLPLTSPFTKKSVLRKYTDREGWFDFDITESGSGLRYAAGEPGFCPSPGAEDYVDSFVEDAYCLEVTLKDGGRHDNDGIRNGQIDDPSYVLEKANAVQVNVRGGSSDKILMSVLLLLLTVRYLSTKKETLHRHTFSK